MTVWQLPLSRQMRPKLRPRPIENARIAIMVRAFWLFSRCGQGQDRTADLPLFRRSVLPSAAV